MEKERQKKAGKQLGMNSHVCRMGIPARRRSGGQECPSNDTLIVSLVLSDVVLARFQCYRARACGQAAPKE
jgi:hypothetical protein